MMKKFLLITAAIISFAAVSISCSTDDGSDNRESIYIEYSTPYSTEEKPEYRTVTIKDGDTISDDFLPELSGNENLTFLGWFAKSAYNDKPYVNAKGKKTTDLYYGESYDGKQIPLYAKWEVQVTVNANEGKINGSETVRSVKFNNLDFTLPDTESLGLARDGYTFICWNKKADGSGNYYQGGANYAFMNKEDYLVQPGDVLYAVWEQGTNVKVINKSVMGRGSDAYKKDLADAEKVLSSLENDDTLFLCGGNFFTEYEKLFGTYLSDSSKKINLNLAYNASGAYMSSSERIDFSNCKSINSVVFGRNMEDGWRSYMTTDYTYKFDGCSILSIILRIGNSKDEEWIKGAYRATVALAGNSFFSRLFTSAENLTLGKTIYKVCINKNKEDWSNIYFEDTSNWYISSKDTLSEAKSADDLTSVSVTNSSENASKMKYNGDWYGKYLYKLPN